MCPGTVVLMCPGTLVHLDMARATLLASSILPMKLNLQIPSSGGIFRNRYRYLIAEGVDQLDPDHVTIGDKTLCDTTPLPTQLVSKLCHYINHDTESDSEPGPAGGPVPPLGPDLDPALINLDLDWVNICG
jgi:hypothetical protein